MWREKRRKKRKEKRGGRTRGAERPRQEGKRTQGKQENLQLLRKERRLLREVYSEQLALELRPMNHVPLVSPRVPPRMNGIERRYSRLFDENNELYAAFLSSYAFGSEAIM